MNKHLRYSSHLLAILMMAGSMPSLMANRAYFSNTSDETITFFVGFWINNRIWYSNIEVYPDASGLPVKHSIPETELAWSNTPDEEMVVDGMRLLLPNERPPSIYSSNNNPEKNDVYVTYKGNSEYNIQLKNQKSGVMTTYDWEAQL